MADWHPLKPINSYSGRDFTLKKGVEYVEIKELYIFKPIYPQAKKKIRKCSVLTLYKKPLRYFDKKVENDFKKLPLSDKDNNAFIHTSQSHLTGVEYWYYNAFMLDSNLKTWRIERVEELIDMVNPIDTPAEVKLVMWVNGYAEGTLTYQENYQAKYKKSGKDYMVKEHYTVTDTAYGECGVYTYQSIVTRAGKVRSRKLLKRDPVEECGGE